MVSCMFMLQKTAISQPFGHPAQKCCDSLILRDVLIASLDRHTRCKYNYCKVISNFRPII